MRTLAEIPARPPGAVGAGTLRRQDMDALGGLLAEVRGDGPVLVTGAGDGRQAVSVGLASIAASEGVRTVLVEADLGSPALADLLGLAPQPGLREYLDGSVEARGILQALVLAGPASGRATEPLTCIVAGEPVPDPAFLLGFDGFQHALAKLSRAYELVVLHGPPLGDGPALERAAAGTGRAIACVGPALASGRAGRKLKRSMRRLASRDSGVVVYG